MSQSSDDGSAIASKPATRGTLDDEEKVFQFQKDASIAQQQALSTQKEASDVHELAHAAARLLLSLVGKATTSTDTSGPSSKDDILGKQEQAIEAQKRASDALGAALEAQARAYAIADYVLNSHDSSASEVRDVDKVLVQQQKVNDAQRRAIAAQQKIIELQIKALTMTRQLFEAQGKGEAATERVTKLAAEKILDSQQQIGDAMQDAFYMQRDAVQFQTDAYVAAEAALGRKH